MQFIRTIEVANLRRRLEHESPQKLKVLLLLARKWAFLILHWVQPRLKRLLTPTAIIVTILMVRFWLRKDIWCLIYAFHAAFLSFLSTLAMKWLGYISEHCVQDTKKRQPRQELSSEGAVLLLVLLLRGTMYGLGQMYVTKRYPRGFSVKGSTSHEDSTSRARENNLGELERKSS